jgi:regulatory protein
MPALHEQRAPSLKDRALRWLARREHSRQELRAKLLRAAADTNVAPQIEALLDQLEASGLLSSARFVENRVHARVARFGNRRIEHELRQHGLVPDAATQDQLRATELTRAREVWRKRFGAPAASPVERARQARFLAARGFPGDIVHKLVSGADEADED